MATGVSPFVSGATSKVTSTNCFGIAEAVIASVESTRMPIRPDSFVFTVSTEPSGAESPSATRGFDRAKASYSSVKLAATSSP